MHIPKLFLFTGINIPDWNVTHSLKPLSGAPMWMNKWGQGLQRTILFKSELAWSLLVQTSLLKNRWISVTKFERVTINLLLKDGGHLFIHLIWRGSIGVRDFFNRFKCPDNNFASDCHFFLRHYVHISLGGRNTRAWCFDACPWGHKIQTVDSGRKDLNLKCLLCLPFRAAESGNFEAAVKLSLAYLYNEGCECGSLSWGFGERGTAQGSFTLLCLGHRAARCLVNGAG